MGRASLLGLCLNSFHKAVAWAYALSLRSRPVPILFSTPSVESIPLESPEYRLDRQGYIPNVDPPTKK